MIFNYPYATGGGGGGKFFGSGVDGVLNLTTGTMSLDPIDNSEALPIVKEYKSIYIAEGTILTASKCCAGMILKCTGDCTIAGTINMNSKAPRRLSDAQIAALNTYYPEPMQRVAAGAGGNGAPAGGKWKDMFLYARYNTSGEWIDGADTSMTTVDGQFIKYSSRSNAIADTRSVDYIWGNGASTAGDAGRFYGGGYSGGGFGGGGHHYSGGYACDGGSASNIPFVGDANVVSVGGYGGYYLEGSRPTTPNTPGASGTTGGISTSKNYGAGRSGGNGNIGGGTIILLVKGDLIITGALTSTGGNGGAGVTMARDWNESSEEYASGVTKYEWTNCGWVDGASGAGGGAGGGKIFIVYKGDLTDTSTKTLTGGSGSTPNVQQVDASGNGGAGTSQIMSYADYKVYAEQTA